MNFFLALFLIIPAFAQSDFQFQQSLKRLIRNASMPDVSPGMVVASPSRTNPNYYYDWVRDTSLSMKALIDVWEISKNPAIEKMLYIWVDSETRRQNTYTLSGLGEPKYNIDGTGFEGPWGRPQNDGPALRAISMIKFGRLLIDSGKRDYVQRKLYGGMIPAMGPVKKDLEYTAHHWREPNFEPWEEEMGLHFYNMLVQYTALKVGSEFAFEMGDGGAAAFYKHEAYAIGEYIRKNFLSEQVGIKVSAVVTRGLGYKHSGIDVTPLLALNHTYPYQDLISLNDPYVKKYLEVLKSTFQNLYGINSTYRGMGVAIGRYPEDRYDGYTTGGKGNPWFLATLAVAEFQCLSGNKRSSRGQFDRVHFHSDKTGQLDEQFNDTTGFMQGAYELTWSHGAYITASLKCQK
ncbi:MAG: glycoside hydrolase family 15 protein [Bdellovibrionota bacterium]